MKKKCGTCRLNRSGLPRKIKDAKLEQKGESIVMHTGPLMAMKMLDRKPVTILSTISKSTPVVTNKKDPKTKESVVRPECIVGYNKFVQAAGPIPQPGASVGRPSEKVEQLRRLTARHFPDKVKSNGKKKNPARMCVVCNSASGKRKEPGESRKRKETTYQCSDCDVGLCIIPCFGLYHKYQDYVQAYRRWKAAEE